jgi:small subunit ribosomal protein S2
MVDYAIPGNDDAIRSVTLLTRVIADAAAEGLMQRHSGGSKTGAEAEAAAEPLAEWERELLAGDTTEGTVETPAATAEGTVEEAAAEAAAAATPATPAEVVEAVEAAEAAPAAAPEAETEK